MSRISSEKAVQQIGNRYNLVLIASHRVRELKKGYLPKVPTTSGATLTALTEIEEGKVGVDYLKKI